ncbi:MAG: Rne/Rng family ribonuclease [Holosporales bacterium]|jgi:ribonuclease E|nr:Rne/Rng family ribonuclease [Holosporales bacterium]
MSRKMFIDATCLEEVRVATTKDGDLKEFESENTAKVRKKGNVYLTKVLRVEPSLQAVFVDYGTERHGFLSLNDIHSDYYQIPIDDKKEFEKHLAEIAEKSNKNEEKTPSFELDEQLRSEESNDLDDIVDDPEGISSDIVESQEQSGANSEDEIEKFKHRFYRKYKIQEVIKPGQILLAQVIKEERGNKCAALTTYISLAGRYCVFMPNSGKPDGISRRISDLKDRVRIREILNEFRPSHFGSIVIRTSGTSSSIQEIEHDYEGLLRLWNEIRETTMNSTAPCLVHEEESFAKRIIRDLYAQDTQEVFIDGEEVYKQVKQFIKSVIPHHTRRIKLYKDRKEPLFSAYKINEQIEKIYQTEVPLKSGGYLVIHPTEALIAIDVNSGKATRERNMEETAFKTNLEAAEEIAKQIRLRDLSGLIVVDFIDMRDKRHVSEIEAKMKEVLKEDRSRSRIAKMSQFGLLEISRQRSRPSIVENTVMRCSHCHGSGIVKSDESLAIHLIRELETELSKSSSATGITVSVLPEFGSYLLNHKKKNVSAIEDKFGIGIIFNSDASLGASKYKLNSKQTVEQSQPVSDKKNTNAIGSNKNNAATNVAIIDNSRRHKAAIKSLTEIGNTTQGAGLPNISSVENENTRRADVSNDDIPRFALAGSNTDGFGVGQKQPKKNPARRRRNPNRSVILSEQPAPSAGGEISAGALPDLERLSKDNPPEFSVPPKQGWWKRILK